MDINKGKLLRKVVLFGGIDNCAMRGRCRDYMYKMGNDMQTNFKPHGRINRLDENDLGQIKVAGK